MIADLKYAIRQLRKSPGFTFVAVLSLALGIGACTSVFSLCNAVLLRSLAVPNPQELRVLRWSGIDARLSSSNGHSTEIGNRTTAESFHFPLFHDLRKQATALADVFGFCPVEEIVARASGGSFTTSGSMVSDNFFSALSVRPVVGRLFQSGDDNPAAGPNVVITFESWEKYFASVPDIIGRSVVLNSTPFTIIGVLPREFAGVQPGHSPEFYVPMQPGSPFLFNGITSDFHWFVRLMARLKPGVTDTQLRAALNPAFAHTVGAVMKDPAVLVEPGRGGPSNERDNYRKPLLLLFGVVGLVMLVACANLAGLSLARGAARQHELAVRIALGSSRWRLLRQSLTESFLLAVVGGLLGILIAVWSRDAIARLLIGSADGLRYDLSLDFAVLGFSLTAALLTALVSGILPALRASRVDPLDGLKARDALAAPRLRVGKILVAAQISLSLVLLATAGLCLRSLANLRQIDAGFTTEKLLVFQLNPFAVGYKEPARLAAFYEQVQSALAAIPGAENAALVQYPLLDNRAWRVGVGIPGRPANPGERRWTHRLTVGETFFATMGIPVLQGRPFTAADNAGAPKVAVINESFARKYFPGENPIGRVAGIFGVNWQIVGLCRDAKYDDIKSDVPPTLYTSFRQYSIDYGACFVVRSTLSPTALTSAVHRAVAAIDPAVPIAHLTTQDKLRDGNLGQERLLASLCGALGALALLLSCIGLYGLMAYHVARRTREIAIRMAIGAQPREVARSILREAFVLVGIGVAVGVPAMLLATRLVQSQLYRVQPNDPATLALAIILLFVVALLAAWLPAQRATKIDPMTALRAE